MGVLVDMVKTVGPAPAAEQMYARFKSMDPRTKTSMIASLRQQFAQSVTVDGVTEMMYNENYRALTNIVFAELRELKEYQNGEYKGLVLRVLSDYLPTMYQLCEPTLFLLALKEHNNAVYRLLLETDGGFEWLKKSTLIIHDRLGRLLQKRSETS